MFDLYKLKIFTIVAQEGSFSAAAERLHMTQSAVSQHMHDLEASLGRQLFDRGWRGVTLTAHGDTLLQYARRIFALVAEAENAVVDVERLAEGQIVLGATPGVGAYLLPEWVQSFRTQYPNLTFSIQTGTTPLIIQDVLALHLPIGFIEGEIESGQQRCLGSVVLRTVEQHVVVGRKHPWWHAEKISFRSLNDQNFVVRPRNSRSRMWLEETLQRSGIHMHITAEYDSLESIKQTIASGQCITVLPDYTFRHEEQLGTIRRIALEDVLLQRDLKLIWEIDTVLSPIVRAFVVHLGTLFEHILDQLP